MTNCTVGEEELYYSHRNGHLVDHLSHMEYFVDEQRMYERSIHKTSKTLDWIIKHWIHYLRGVVSDVQK